MPTVICTCSKCSSCKITVDGVQQPGRRVAASTRLDHEKKDKRPRTPEQKCPTSSSSVPKRPMAPDPPKGTELVGQLFNLLTDVPDIAFPLEYLVTMICVLATWLHLRAGVSRSVANTTLQAIHLIISTTLQIVEAVLFSSGINIKLSNIKIPRDIRTAYTHHFTEPDIIRTACCPTCFSLYSSPIPYKCQWKESPRSRPCNTDLWKRKNTPKGPKMVPRRLYTTQSFDSWIRFFLSRPIIVDSLEETARRCTNNPPAFGAEMRDIQDSPAWRDVTGHLFNPHRLVFGLYVDWFNPFTNKVAGKPIISVSHKFG
jgi:hypothetical protein